MKIENNIPIPKKIANYPIKYNFKNMKVGDSIFFNRMNNKKRCSVFNSAKYFCKVRKLNWKFTTRTVEGGIRIWRIKQ